MPKPSLSNNIGSISPIAAGIKGSSFPKGIYPKVNVLMRLDFELAYYADQHFPISSGL